MIIQENKCSALSLYSVNIAEYLLTVRHCATHCVLEVTRETDPVIFMELSRTFYDKYF